MGFWPERVLAQVDPQKNVQSADIRWEEVEGVDGYHLQIAQDEAFSNILVDTKTVAAKFTWSAVRAGFYFVRIASMKEEQKSSYSVTKLLVRSYGPRLYSPKHRAKLKFDPLKAKKLVFSWESVPNAEFYQVQVSRTSDFKKMVVDRVIKGFKVRVKELKEGAYLWRIRVKQKGQPFGAWSLKRYFEWRPGLSEKEYKQDRSEVVNEITEIEDVEPEPEDPPFVLELEEIPEPLVYSLEFGAGVNAHSFKQTQPSTDTTFLSLSPGSYFFGFSVHRPHYWRLGGWYKNNPGEVITESEVDAPKYDWSSFGMDFDWTLKESAKWNGALRVGVQSHQSPFINLQDGNVLRVESNNLVLAALGGRASYNYSLSWDFDVAFHYLHPLSSSGQSGKFEVSESLGFGGHFKSIYHWKPNWKIIGAWHGQYLKHSYVSDAALSSSGEQEMFFSSVEARILYKF